MEDFKKKMSADMNDKEIVFSKSIKAGKRIYYLCLLYTSLKKWAMSLFH